MTTTNTNSRSVSRATIDTNLRNEIFAALNLEEGWKVTSNLTRGIVQLDETGTPRYVTLKISVAKPSEEMTAQEALDFDVAEFERAQAEKAAKAAEKAEKARKDKERRAKEAAEKAAIREAKRAKREAEKNGVVVEFSGEND